MKDSLDKQQQLIAGSEHEQWMNAERQRLQLRCEQMQGRAAAALYDIQKVIEDLPGFMWDSRNRLVTARQNLLDVIEPKED